MAYKTLNFKITGVAPLLMHNGQLANPLHDVAKQIKKITSKTNMTDADHEEKARLEWHGSLYLHEGKPCLPGEVLEAAFVAAARRQKMGKQAQAGIFCPDNYPLDYDGPQSLEKLWADPDHRLTVAARVKQNRPMRTRPIFRDWSCKIEVQFDDSLLNEEDVKRIVRVTGETVGIGDWRPKFGRFKVE